ASIEACDKTFAGVGSVSAFDQGGAPVIQQCGMPDIRGLSTTNPMKKVPNAFPINAAGTGGARSTGMFGWAAEKFPDAIKKAAYVYIDGEVTRELANEDMEATKAVLGYNWIYSKAIGITETNYGPVVQQLKNSGAEYVTFTGAQEQAASLAKQFKTQGFEPTVWQPTVTAYTPNYISGAGAAAEGTYIAVTASLNEEMGINPELKTYAQWLNQVAPGKTPTGIGQFAWGAAALFVEKMKEIGPKPTRKALLATLPKVRSYTGNGLFPGQDVGGRQLSSCTKVVQVKGGKFVRFTPEKPGSNRCVDKIYDTKTKKASEGFPD
ncbi:MAG TPA: ABC transporter substrate-binding protein, partial [Egibacteraceae bacterium]|nr:ABC transporter substrate-binding protein [Egibacteraceae bacterium]